MKRPGYRSGMLHNSPATAKWQEHAVRPHRYCLSWLCLRRLRDQTSVVAAIEKQSIFANAQALERLLQSSDLLIKQSDFTKITRFFRRLIVVERRGPGCLRQFLLRIMRRRKPGNDKHRFFTRMMSGQKVDGGIHADHCPGTFDLLVLSIATEIRIVVKVQPRKPFVKSCTAGTGGTTRHRTDMPLSSGPSRSRSSQRSAIVVS